MAVYDSNSSTRSFLRRVTHDTGGISSGGAVSVENVNVEVPGSVPFLPDHHVPVGTGRVVTSCS